MSTESVKKRVKKSKSKLKSKSSLDEHDMILYDADTNTLYSRNTSRNVSRAGSECSNRGSSGVGLSLGLDTFRRITRSMSGDYSGRNSFCSTASTVRDSRGSGSLSSSLSNSGSESIAPTDIPQSIENCLVEDTEVVDIVHEPIVPLVGDCILPPGNPICTASYEILESLLDKYTASEVKVQEEELMMPVLESVEAEEDDQDTDSPVAETELLFDTDLSLDTSLNMDLLNIADELCPEPKPAALTLNDLMETPPVMDASHTTDNEMDSMPTIDLDSNCMRRSTRRASMATSGKFCQTKKKEKKKKEKKLNIDEALSLATSATNESLGPVETATVERNPPTSVDTLANMPLAYRNLIELYKSVMEKENKHAVLTGIDYSMLVVMMLAHSDNSTCSVEKFGDLSMCLVDIGMTMNSIHKLLAVSESGCVAKNDTKHVKRKVRFSEFGAINPPNDRVPGSWKSVQSVSHLYIHLLQLISTFKAKYPYSIGGLCNQLEYCLGMMHRQLPAVTVVGHEVESIVLHCVTSFIVSEFESKPDSHYNIDGISKDPSISLAVDLMRDSMIFLLSGLTAHRFGGSPLQYQVSWMLNSVVRSQLRFLFDGEPEFLTANLAVSRKPINKRSLVAHSMGVNYESAITATSATNVDIRRTTNSAKKPSKGACLLEAVKDMPVSVLLTNALHQVYELFHDLHLSRERDNITNAKSVLNNVLERLKQPSQAESKRDADIVSSTQDTYAYIGPHDGVLRTMNEAMRDKQLFSNWLNGCDDEVYKRVVAKTILGAESARLFLKQLLSVPAVYELIHVGSTIDKTNWDIITQFSYLLTHYGSNEDNYLSLLSNGTQLYQLVSLEWFEDSLVAQCIQMVESPIKKPKKSTKKRSVLSVRNGASLNTEIDNTNTIKNFDSRNVNENKKENGKGSEILGKPESKPGSEVFLDTAYYTEYCNYINENNVIITAFPVIDCKNNV